jgi:hypothetical protein
MQEGRERRERKEKAKRMREGIFVNIPCGGGRG